MGDFSVYRAYAQTKPCPPERVVVVVSAMLRNIGRPSYTPQRSDRQRLGHGNGTTMRATPPENMEAYRMLWSGRSVQVSSASRLAALIEGCHWLAAKTCLEP